jgi:hypothetical protein
MYLAHCRSKASAVIAAESAEMLSGPCGFPPRKFSRAELLRLRLNFSEDIPWFGSGWREV